MKQAHKTLIKLGLCTLFATIATTITVTGGNAVWIWILTVFITISVLDDL